MATKKSFPMIPANVWWKLREQFQKTLPGTVTRTYLATVLGVDERTAGNLLSPLRTIGLIDKDGKITERANHWRFDEDYASVCKGILEEVYPEELRHAVPEPQSNREAAVRWFMKTAGVGEGGAGKMASTYQIVSAATPRKTEPGSQPKQPRQRPQKRPSAAVQPSAPPVVQESLVERPPGDDETTRQMEESSSGTPSIHLDINVHISSDASAEQIDQIFASMARHLYNKK